MLAVGLDNATAITALLNAITNNGQISSREQKNSG